MIEREVEVSNKLGIHARPASLIVKLASQYTSSINFIKDGESGDAKSIMNILMLAAEHKSKILIQADGPDAKTAVESIMKFFKNNFEIDRSTITLFKNFEEDKTLINLLKES
ncbi:MAG: HPr family phosphocarrier protein [Chitinispirillia bacterium]|jgi:phosphocarrier protein